MTALVSSSLLRWILPARCVLCDDAGAMLCAACQADATASSVDVCRCCALPLPSSLRPTTVALVCGRCLKRPPAFDRTCAAAAYAPPFDQLVQGLKYGATLAYAPLLAALADQQARAVLGAGLDAIDVVLPVPSSRQRMTMRGFNQAIEIARGLAAAWNRPLDCTSALRVHDTAPQAGLDLRARRRNVRGAFAITDVGRIRLRDRHVAVVDDVMTTGATLDELARRLKDAGVAVVVNVVVARRH